MLEVGAQMPAFTMRNTQRDEVTQDDFAGSITVLAFYPMAFTGG
ncbi:MAG: redoxin domain-containing protein [Dehalococcoidia bacterium]|jgi:peroxiredoxin|nr:redoxin domain-containing protein [Dehalococcoidia bacterium]